MEIHINKHCEDILDLRVGKWLTIGGHIINNDSGLNKETDIPYSPCVRSGYCCKQAPCAYGGWNEDKTQCKFLNGDKAGEYSCGKYEEISQTIEGKQGYFGAGCSSALFNKDREKVIIKLKKDTNLM